MENEKKKKKKNFIRIPFSSVLKGFNSTVPLKNGYIIIVIIAKTCILCSMDKQWQMKSDT